MREICTSGSVGGEGGNSLAYPALSARSARAHGIFDGLSAWARAPIGALSPPYVPPPVCRNASPTAIAHAIATLSERRPGRIGINSRASAAA
jgi:hypothetical protein